MADASRRCPVCGSEKVARLAAESTFDPSRLTAHSFSSRKRPEMMHHRMVECASCGLLYASPLPAVGLDEAYRDAAFDASTESAFAARTYMRYLSPVIEGLRERTAALDIGAGDGAFVKLLGAAGFPAVSGVEPSSEPLAAAPESIRRCIRHSMFEKGMFAPEQFDFVSCFQTMEHVVVPREIVGEVFRILKPGGVFAVIAHDYRAPVNRLLGTRSPIFDIEHLQLFSAKSVTALLVDGGFRHVKTTRITNTYPCSYWLKLLPVSAPVRSFLQSLLRIAHMDGAPLSLPVGNLLATGYRQ